jgi:hypothetical protein
MLIFILVKMTCRGEYLSFGFNMEIGRLGVDIVPTVWAMLA